MLSSLDDMLWHQLPVTFDHVGTSDPRFFDRYWFAINAPDGGHAVQFTMGVYSNMNVVDAGFVVVRSGQQHNLRVSRSLRPHFVSSCGPLSVEIVKPMEHLRLTVGAGEHGTAAEIDWHAIGAAEEESPHYERKAGRVVQDYRRFNQLGEASGWLSIQGKRVDVDRWWACRDHSWGVRPDIGVAEPVTGPAAPTRAPFLFAFLFFSTNTLAGHFQVMEKASTERYVTGLIRDRATDDAHRLVDGELIIEFHPGTRRMRTATFVLSNEAGKVAELLVEAEGFSIAMPGLGYSTASLGYEGGWNDGGGLGAWRGNDHRESEVWDIADPVEVFWRDGSVHRPPHRIQPVRVRGSDGSAGQGSLTLIATGDLPQFGLPGEAAS